MKLPLTRAAACLIPLVTIIIAVAAARLSYAGLAAISFLLVGFVLALRVSYFAEWKYNAGIKDAVITAANYANARHLPQVGVTAFEQSSISFYRKMLGYEFQTVQPGERPVPNLDVYIVGGGTSLGRDLEQSGFRALYRNAISGIRVFVRNGT